MDFCIWCPKKILSDNEAEFNNDDVRQLGYFFNVRILTTSAESQWNNGTCERLNGDLVKKIMLDGGDIEIAL